MKTTERKPITRACMVCCLFLLAVLTIFCMAACGKKDPDALYREKADLLREQLAGWVLTELGAAPAGDVGHAVFLSVCDGDTRALVFHGTGETPEAAWAKADEAAAAAVAAGKTKPEWVKADIVYLSETIPLAELERAVYSSRHEFFRYGLALDPAWNTALLEAEMNGAKIYEYEEGGIDRSYLNTYLEKAGREAECLDTLPEEVTVFQCLGWLCDEENEIHALDASGYEYGRRTPEVDDELVEEILYSATDFLLEQIRPDGTFVYGMYPRFDNDIENYNIVRHASTIWSLLCRYRMEPSEELKAGIENTIGYMLTQLVTGADGASYLYEEKDDEIKLGACGVAVIAMTEYMDVFANRKYEAECTALGHGILSMLDMQNGTYTHVWNGDLTEKEAFRTVYYDGEATFALCRLYSLTENPIWLEAACAAVDHFIEGEYEQYADHWISYTMNEITRYVDSDAYWNFALRNLQSNLPKIAERDTTYHTYLELLMAGFEIYDRMTQAGKDTSVLDPEALLETISIRADRMLNGFFFPEYAMYMENPDRVLGTFMVRHDGYRIRIDDVQHNIGGYYLYWKNYDKLTAYGME